MFEPFHQDVDRGPYKSVTPFEDPDWRRHTVRWIQEALLARGLPPQWDGWRVRLRPWSVLYRVPLAGGNEIVWFKANPPKSRFEAPLLAALARLRPDDVLAPLAFEPDEGWSLQPDGGQVYAGRFGGDPEGISASGWAAPLRQYAAFQHTMAPHSEELAHLGVPVINAATLAETTDRIAEAAETVSEDDRKLLDSLLSDFPAWSRELADFGIPDALDHGDLHARQLLGPDSGGRFRFFDWGDAAITHPFCSLMSPSRAARRRHGHEGAAAAEQAVRRLLDAYLEPWVRESGLDRADLDRAVVLACRVAAVTRITVWNRVFPGNTGSGNGWAEELATAADPW
jgi:hypothetical protein